MEKEWTHDSDDTIRVMNVTQLGDMGRYILLADSDLAQLCLEHLDAQEDIPITLRVRDGCIMIERRGERTKSPHEWNRPVGYRLKLIDEREIHG